MQEPSHPDRPERRIRFVDQEDARAISKNSLLGATFSKGLQNAFAKHALNQKGASPSKSRLVLTLRHRALLLGHRAGLWLNNFTYESFYDSAKVLVLHQYQTFDVRGTHNLEGKLNPADIYVDVKTGDDIQTHHLGSNVAANRKKFTAKIQPLLEQKSPKHLIRVRGVDLECGFDCNCGDSTEIQVEAPDYGFLDMKADWHLWKEKLITNSIIFEVTVLDTLFPSPPYDEANHFTLEVADQSFQFTRGVGFIILETFQSTADP